MKKLGKVLLMLILTLAVVFQYMPVAALSTGAGKEQGTEETPSPSASADTDTAEPQQTAPAQSPVADNNQATDEAQPGNESEQAVTNGIAANDIHTEKTYINGVSFAVTSDGTAPFDDDNGRGDDQDEKNGRVRSYDNVKYKVSTTFQAQNGESVEGKNLYYEITVPNDDQLELDWEGSGIVSQSDVTTAVNGDQKTYTFHAPLTTSQSGAKSSGTVERTVVMKVLGMKEGQKFQPSVRCWMEGNEANTTPEGGTASNTAQAAETTVTSAPAYNIILKKGGVSGLTDFHFNTDESKNLFDNTTYDASDYANATVKGYGVTWGVAVEMRKADTSKGIRGIEYPDPVQGLRFDVDLSDASFTAGKKTENTTSDWAPLLYRVRENSEGYSDHISVKDLPGSKQADGNDTAEYCYDSGTYSVVQDGTKLHFTVKNFAIDPLKFPKTSLNDNNVSYYTDIQKILEGVFTSAQFTVVYPMVNSHGDDIQKKIGETGNYGFKAKAENLHAVSVDGTTTDTETVPVKDNSAETQANVTGGHGHSQQVFFSNKGNITEGSDNAVSGSMRNKQNDSDSATQGSEIFFTTCWDETNATSKIPAAGRTVAADQLVLVEGNAIEIEKAARYDHSVSRGYKLYPMYVTADHPLTFEETKTLKIDSPILHYFDGEGDQAIKKIPADQYVVGVLLRWRGISYSIVKDGKGNDVDENRNGDALLSNQTIAKVRDGAEYAGKVYSITVQTNLYDTDIMSDVTDKFTEDESERNKADAYRAAARSDAYLGNGPLVVTSPSLTPDKNGTFDSRSSYVNQPQYDETGYHTNHDFGLDRADSLYVVPYYTEITKTIAQKDKTGATKSIYNQDYAERYVDYRLTGSLHFSDSGMSYVDGQKKTTITITDEIPAGLTYVANSAVWNPDSYEQLAGKPGQITVGTKIEPVIDSHEDGSATLTWTIENVDVVNGDLPALYYTCSINNNVTGNSKLNNKATIHSADEKRAICSANKNESEAGISVIRNGGFNINIFGDHDLELNDDATFTLVASNATTTPRKDFLLVDSMPWDGKKTGSEKTTKKGAYNVTSVTIDNDPEVIGEHGTDDIDIYYTDDEKYAGLKDLRNLSRNEIRTWTKADKTVTEGSDPSWNVSGWPAAIAVIDQDLGASNTLLVTIHYEAKADKDDHLVNYLMTPGADNATSHDESDAVIYDRKLNGTVWIDKNCDGIMDHDEKRVEGVTVQLMSQAADGTWQPVDTYTDTDGKERKAVTATDQNGYYEFTKLKPGNYKVAFTNGDTSKYPASDLSQYYMTDPNKGKDSKVNSKTDKEASQYTDGKLTEGDIPGIKMPTIDEMKAGKTRHYVLSDQNMGLYPVQRSLSGKVWFDANGDGIYQLKDTETAKQEYPMAGVKVSLYKKGTDNKFAPYKENGKTVTAETKADGSYEFTGLPAGDYQVVFSDGSADNAKISDFDVTQSNQDTDVGTRSVADKGEKKGTAVVSHLNDGTKGKIQLDTDSDLISHQKTEQTIPDLNAGFKPSSTKIEVTKKWNDSNNLDNQRLTADQFKTAVSLEQFVAGTDHKTATGDPTVLKDHEPEITDHQNDTYTIVYKDLPTVSYDGKTFTYYVYKVKEDISQIPGYTAEKEKTEAEDGEIITNTHPVDFDRKLSGKVWFDADGNGIFDTDEYPMKGVRVSLYVKTQNGYEPYKTGDDEVSTTTDDHGYYEFANLPAGQYKVVFDNGDDEASRISQFKLTSRKQGEDPKTRSVADEEKDGTVSVTEQNDVKGDIVLKTDEKLSEEKTKSQEIPDLNAGFVPEKTSISVTKVWDDENNRDNLRPSAEDFSKYLHLYRHDADNENEESVEVTGVKPEMKDNDNNTYTIKYSNLDSVSYDGSQFTHYFYTVKEDPVNGYWTDSAEVKDQDTIKNIHYNRGFSGKTWFDADRNGTLDHNSKDKVLGGIKVTLQKQNEDGSYTDVTDADGNPVTTVTDQNGEYKFTDLEPGTYQVVIDRNQFVTKKSNSSDGTKSIASNDQFDENGKPVSAVIATITMPTDDEIRSMNGNAPEGSELRDDGKTYTLLHQDAGFIDFKPVKTETTPGKNQKPTTKDGDTVKTGDQITYTVLYMNTHAEKADVTITDYLDPNVSFVSADQNGSYAASAHTVTWVLKDVEPYKQGTVQLTVKVEEGAVAQKRVQNTAEVKVGNDTAQKTNTVTNPVNPTPEKPVKPDDKKVKKNRLPYTGDRNHSVFYGGLLAISMIFIVWRMIAIRKEQEHD